MEIPTERLNMLDALAHQLRPHRDAFGQFIAPSTRENWNRLKRYRLNYWLREKLKHPTAQPESYEEVEYVLSQLLSPVS